jgi:hypothetical protein
MKKLLLYLLVFIYGECLAQQAPPPITAAPTAAALGKYGEIPVSNYTGIPQISIPLYTLSGKSISLPISLSYHAGGIRTEENASWVGLGWSLNAGGVITRTVRGLADDDPHGGYSTATFPSGPLTYANYFDEVHAYLRDSAPDLYFFNFNGYTGKFVLDPSDKPTPTTIRAFLIPKSDLEIVYDISQGAFIAKTPDGVKYTLSETETTQQTIYSVDAKNNPGAKKDTVAMAISSWFMSTIESPTSKDKIFFKYNSENYQYESSKKGSAGYRTSGTLHSLTYNYSVTRVYGKTLSEISLPLFDTKVVFQANKVREDLESISTIPSFPKALEQIQVWNTSKNLLVKKFLLNTDYFQTQSVRFDVNQVPASEKYQYKRLKLLSVQEVAGDGTNKKPPHSFDYNNISLPPKNSEFQDHWGYINQTSDSIYNFNSGRYLIPGFTGEVDHSKEFYGMACVGDPLTNQVPVTGITYLNVTGVDREVNERAMQAGSLTKITYPTGGSTIFEMEGNKFGFINKESYHEPKYIGYHYGAFAERPGNNFSTAINDEIKTETFTVEQDKVYEVVFDLENTTDQSGLNFTKNEISLTGVGPSGSSTVLRLYYDWSPYYDPYRIVFFDEASQKMANLPLNISQTNYSAQDETGLPTNEGVSRKVIHGTRLVRLHPGITYTLQASRQYDQWQNCSSPGSTGCLINNNFVNIAMTTPILREAPADSNTVTESLAGGLRIRAITEKAESSSPEMRTNYLYRLHDTLGRATKVSSGVILSKPNHTWNLLYKTEDNQNGCVECSSPITVYPCQEYAVQVYNVFTLSSNVPTPLATTQGSPIGYREVEIIKSGNGSAIYRYFSPFEYPDQLPQAVNIRVSFTEPSGIITREFSAAAGLESTGYTKVFVPTRSYDWKRGLLDSTTYLNQSRQKVSGARNFYTFHEASSEIRGLNILFDILTYNDLPQPAIPERHVPLQKEVDYIDYKEVSGWASLDKKIESSHSNGNTYTYTDFEYNSPYHMLATSVRQKGSDQKIIEENFVYSADKPNDLQMSSALLNEIVDNRHMLNIPFKRTKSRGGQLISTETTTYQIDYQNVVPKSKTISYGANLETRLTYNKYDINGNLKEYAKDVSSSAYLWGYNSTLPIAAVKGAKETEAYLANIEEKTDFQDGIMVTDTTHVHSGHFAGRITQNGGELTAHSKTWLQINQNWQPRRYHYSGWVYSDGPSVEIFLFMKRPGEQTYYSYVDRVMTEQTGKWVYLSKDFEVPGDVVQINIRVDNNGDNGGGSVWFDDIRLHPSEALMTSYTYDPLIGMTSQMDEKGMTTYFEYDGFQRLRNVKDQNGKILKHYDYHYAKGN